jgi:hypothetical protein
MKPKSSTKKATPLLVLVTFALLPAACAQQSGHRGMPPAAKEQIHALLDNHSKIQRDVKITATGYTATTESADPKVTAALQKHVQQMQERLKSGLSVRRWDPAFAEYCDHYTEMDHEFATTAKGVSMTVTGQNAAAIKIAQNHAKVVSAFAAHGWSEHDKEHATVAH